MLTTLKDLTGGIGPDGCIDAVGMESHSAAYASSLRHGEGRVDAGDRQAGSSEAGDHGRTERRDPLNSGVYGGLLDKVPFGAAFGKGITMKMGQTNMHKYMKPLLEKIEKGQIDPSYIISHRITLDDAPEMYKTWRDKKEQVTKIVIDPWAGKAA